VNPEAVHPLFGLSDMHKFIKVSEVSLLNYDHDIHCKLLLFYPKL
jgi:hypothetical protein